MPASQISMETVRPSYVCKLSWVWNQNAPKKSGMFKWVCLVSCGDFNLLLSSALLTLRHDLSPVIL